MSLRINLNKIIEDRAGQVFTLNELEEYCHKAQYKLSNAERVLRPSKSPNVEGVWNDKRTAIIGYRLKVSENVANFLREFPSNPIIKNQLF